MPMTSLPPGVSRCGFAACDGAVQPDGDSGDCADRTTMLVIGIKESANLNSAIVIVKLDGSGHLSGAGRILSVSPSCACADELASVHSAAGRAREFRLDGIALGAASIFFAYIGFDAVSTAAQEAKNPQRDMPIGILGSLVVCTILYISVSLC